MATIIVTRVFDMIDLEQQATGKCHIRLKENETFTVHYTYADQLGKGIRGGSITLQDPKDIIAARDGTETIKKYRAGKAQALDKMANKARASAAAAAEDLADLEQMERGKPKLEDLASKHDRMREAGEKIYQAIEILEECGELQPYQAQMLAVIKDAIMGPAHEEEDPDPEPWTIQ